MITIARHIELLLLEHDCVIVPGLGGFIANHAEAHYEGGEEHLFLPPYRTVGFNQQLQVNDGLLVQSYMSAYDTSYPFASLQMEEDLGKMLHELEMEGRYELEGIGTLTKGLNGNIAFTPQLAGALTPSLYGLYSCDIQTLGTVIKEREIASSLQAASTMHVVKGEDCSPMNTAATSSIYKHSGRQAHRFHRRWLDVGIAAAASVLLFFGLSYPSMQGLNGESDTVVAAFVAPKSVPQRAPATKNTQQSPVLATNTKTMSKSGESGFSIVLASYVNQENAERFLGTLNKEGFKQGRYVKEGKMSRILYSNYASHEEAQQALNQLRLENSAFNEAWILKL